jgi:hypothetical protein
MLGHDRWRYRFSGSVQPTLFRRSLTDDRPEGETVAD